MAPDTIALSYANAAGAVPTFTPTQIRQLHDTHPELLERLAEITENDALLWTLGYVGCLRAPATLSASRQRLYCEARLTHLYYSNEHPAASTLLAQLRQWQEQGVQAPLASVAFARLIDNQNREPILNYLYEQLPDHDKIIGDHAAEVPEATQETYATILGGLLALRPVPERRAQSLELEDTLEFLRGEHAPSAQRGLIEGLCHLGYWSDELLHELEAEEAWALQQASAIDESAQAAIRAQVRAQQLTTIRQLVDYFVLDDANKNDLPRDFELDVNLYRLARDRDVAAERHSIRNEYTDMRVQTGDELPDVEPPEAFE